jgi:L-fuconolactonase
MPAPATERLDAHQHFWKYDADQYPWIPPGSPLHRDWLPEDLAREQAPLDLQGSIAVQARQSLAESRWLLELADHHERIRGVVGWVDLRADTVEADLSELAANPKFVGVRHVVQDEPDDRFLLGERFVCGISKLRQFELTYDLLIYPRQLASAIELAKRFPDQPFVLDHIAKPEIRAGKLDPWREQIRELSKHRNVHCKVSGMVTEADHRTWKKDDIRPYLDVIFDAFDISRLMWGSDWPVCLLAAKYEEVFTIVDEYTRTHSQEERDALFGGNARRFYFGERSSPTS